MAITILWTKRAEAGFDKIIRYLEKEFTNCEVGSFVRETMHFLELLKKNPEMLEKTKKHRILFRGPMNRLTIVTYRYKSRKNVIELVNIRSSRQKPLR